LQVFLDLWRHFHENVLRGEEDILWDSYFSGTA
jgi:hypothetical protein